MKKRIEFFSIVLLLFSLFSCEFNNPTKLVNHKLNFNIQIDTETLPEELIETSSRSAHPSIPSNIYYKINVFEKSNKSTPFYTTFASNSNPDFSVESTKSFPWTVEVTGYDALSAFTANDSTLILYNSIDVTSEESDIEIKMLPDKRGTGSVNLELLVDSNVETPIEKCIAVWDGKSQSIDFSDNKGIFTLLADGETSVQTGIYSVTFYFYTDKEANNLCYIEPEQKINVFRNLSTTYWKTEDGSYSKQGFEITKDKIENFNLVHKNIFFVDSNASSVDADGSFFKPYNSISKVLEDIVLQNTPDDLYGIFLLSDLVASSSDIVNNSFINLTTSLSKLNLYITSYKDNKYTINANSLGRVIYTDNKTSLSLENVNITGGFVNRNSGAGIYAKGQIYLDNVDIYENISSTVDSLNKGGGIYSTNIIEIENSKIYNNQAQSGGGIYVDTTSATELINISITSSTIGGDTLSSGNNAHNGAGIYIEGKNTNCVIDDSSFQNNYGGTLVSGAVQIDTGDCGGAICFMANDTSSTLSLMNSTSIKGNHSFNGGGLFTSKVYVTLYSGINFESNTAKCSGGAIFAVDESYIRLENAGIKFIGNRALYEPSSKEFFQYEGGGAVYVNNSTFAAIDTSSSQFENNFSAYMGGGLLGENSSSLILNNITFENNSTSTNTFMLNGVEKIPAGGHIAAKGSGVISDTFIATGINLNKGSSIYGGGIYLSNIYSVSISDSLIGFPESELQKEPVLLRKKLSYEINPADWANVADEGGGIYCDSSNTVIVSNSQFNGNIAQGSINGRGGAISIYNSNISVQKSSFLENVSLLSGGVLSLINDAPAQSDKMSSFAGGCIMNNNVSLQSAGVYCKNGNLLLTDTSTSNNISGNSFANLLELSDDSILSIASVTTENKLGLSLINYDIKVDSTSSSVSLAKSVDVDSIFTKQAISLTSKLFSTQKAINIYLPKVDLNIPNSIYLATGQRLFTSEITAENCDNFVLEDGFFVSTDGLITDVKIIALSSSLASLDPTVLYTISSKEELNALASLVNKSVSTKSINFILLKDIDLQATKDNPFTPIGNSLTSAFSGNFNGNNKCIRNLYVKSTLGYAGLFGFVNDGSIGNLKVIGQMEAASKSGGIVGYIKRSSKNVEINNCLSAVNITSSNVLASSIGGIVGESDGSGITIRNCINIGNIKTSASDVGGIIGKSSSVSIENCANYGNISGTSNVAGILNSGAIADTSIDNTVNGGTISSITPLANASIITSSVSVSNSPLTNVFSYPNVASYVAGTLSSLSGKITMVQDDFTETLLSYKLSLNISGHDDYNDWLYYYKTGEHNYPSCIEIPDDFIPEEISEPEEDFSVAYLMKTNSLPTDTTNPYTISTEEELFQLAEWVNDGNDMTGISFLQSEDIILTKEFTPIGNMMSTAFKGSYSGGRKAIKNLSINTPDDSYAGLFGFLSKAIIEQVYVEGSIVSSGYTGGIAGYAVDGAYISECVSNVNITANGQYYGGIIGYCDDCMINRVVNLGSITSNNSITSGVGGIVGYSDSTGFMANYCVNFGELSGNSNVGGLLGYSYSKDFYIGESYNVGKVSALNTTERGAISGSANCESTCFSDCYWLSTSCTRDIAKASSNSLPTTTLETIRSDLNTISSDNWNGVYDSWPVPVSFMPEKSSQTGAAGSYVQIDSSYQSMQNFNLANIPPANSKLTASSVDDIKTLAEMVNSSAQLKDVEIVLTSDIDLSNENLILGKYSGGKYYPFSGTIDGNGYTITSMSRSETSGAWGTGFIGNVSDGAVIKNLIINDISVNTTSRNSSFLIGYATGNVLVENVVVNGELTSTNGRIGGIVGNYTAENDTDKLTIRNCIVSGNITGTNTIGGIIGSNEKGVVQIENCACYCTITHSNGESGGIFNTFVSPESSIKNCIFGGSIKITSNSSNKWGAICESFNDTSVSTNYEYFYMLEGCCEKTLQSYHKDLDYIYNYTGHTTSVPPEEKYSYYKEEGSDYMLTKTMSYNGVNYTNLKDILNAWCDKNSSGSINYKRWDYIDGKMMFIQS